MAKFMKDFSKVKKKVKAIPKAMEGVKAANERDSDRTFILFGKSNCGKSTLGNLLLGEKPFKEHARVEAFGLTINVHSGDCKINAAHVYDDVNGDDDDEMIKIQVFDQPGFNDDNFLQEKNCKFLRECIAGSKAEMSASFLILIALNKRFSSEELLSALNLAEIMSESCYSFFPNATIVFTHSDKIDESLNREILEKKLEKQLETEEFKCVQELIDLVDGRYMFINSKDKSEINRSVVLNKLFTLTRQKLTVYINGNNGFKGEELKELFGEDINVDSFERNLLKYDIECHFNPDLNLFKKFEKSTLEENITRALNKLSGITRGISAMVLLVSLEEVFNNEIYNLILNLPKTYKLGKEFKNDFWDYACILFKVPDGSEECVRTNIEKNRLLKTLDIKVKSRFAWVTDITSPDKCARRLIELVKRVKLDTEGKSYTDSVVLAEMKHTIKGSYKHRNTIDKAKMGGDIKDNQLRNAIPFYQLETSPKLLVECNNFFWDKEFISPIIGYYILKNLNSDKAEQFREKYPDKEKKIPTSEYSQYCLKALQH